MRDPLQVILVTLISIPASEARAWKVPVAFGTAAEPISFGVAALPGNEYSGFTLKTRPSVRGWGSPFPKRPSIFRKMSISKPPAYIA